MELGGWVKVSLRIFFFENHPKIALNQYRYFGVVYHMCSAQIMGTESVAYTHKNKGSCFLF